MDDKKEKHFIVLVKLWGGAVPGTVPDASLTPLAIVAYLVLQQLLTKGVVGLLQLTHPHTASN